MKMKKFLKYFIAIAIFSLLCVSSLYIYIDMKWSKELQNTIKILNINNNLPKKNELIPHKIDDSNNAAIEFENIFKIMTSGDGAKEFAWKGGQKYNKLIETLLTVKYPVDSKLWAEINNNEIIKDLSSNEINKITFNLEKAENKTGLNFNLNYDAGPEMLLPHLDVIRKLYKIVCLEAVYLAHIDKLNQAYHLLLAALKTVNLLQQEPIIITQLIRIAAEKNIISTYELLVFEFGIQNDYGKKFLLELSKHNTIKPFVKVADTEMVFMGMYIFNTLLYGNSKKAIKQIGYLLDNPLFFNHIPIFILKPFLKKDYSEYLKQMTKFKTVLKIPYWQLSKENFKMLNTADELPVYCIISKLITPSLINLLKKATKFRTEINKAILFTAIHLHINKHGHQPKSVSELAEELKINTPIDYFTGKELRLSEALSD